MDRNNKKIGLINWSILLLTTIVSVVVARYVGSTAGLMGSALMGIGLLIALVSYFQMRLEERERLEKLEFDELSKAKGGSTLFTQEAESFPAQRSRLQFEKYFIPFFTVFLFIAECAVIFWHWRFLEKQETTLVTSRSLVAASLFGLQFLVLFLMGKFSAGLARLDQQKLLRAGSGYLLLGAYISLILAATIAATVFGEMPKLDLYVARVLSVLIGLIAIESLIGLMLELYRPRVKGKEARVLYESRLVGLLGQPEGIFKTAAHALDYQFGFKVSETWFYRFLQKSFAWLILAQLAVLLLSTCFVFIETGEEALLERFGRPVEGRGVLGSGLHVKLPSPIDRVHRYRTEQIQSFTIGVQKDDDHDEKTVLWTVSHEAEENMIVASRPVPGASQDRKSPPVNLISVSIPVQFQITNLLDWAYNHKNANELLERIAHREVVRYLVSADVNEIMSHGRAEAAISLKDRIQKASDSHRLGARIVFVGLQDIHPPVSVASEYERVVGMIQLSKAARLNAQAYSIQTNALSLAAASNVVSRAEADRLRSELSALAHSASFTNQLPAYEASPSVYSQRAYLQAFSRGSQNARKYVLSTTNTQEVIELNLEEKIRSDLIDRLTVPPTK